MPTMRTEVTPRHFPRRAGRILGAAVSAGAVAILLSGCNSSTSTTPATPTIPETDPSFDAAEARRLTGAENPPPRAIAESARRAAELEPEIDYILGYGAFGDGRDIENFEFECVDTTTCTWTDPQSGETVTVELSDSTQTAVGTNRAVLTKNGITLLEAHGGDNGPDYRVYGAWMNHVGFTLETALEVTTGDGTTLVARGATVFGDSTGTRPTTDVTWRGVMVGTPVRGSRRNNILQGDARLDYRISRGEIDATFSNIVNLDREAPHSVQEIQFLGIPVSNSGVYGDGDIGNSIDGKFYGPDHAETGGAFEQRGIVGAYGAKRQAD